MSYIAFLLSLLLAAFCIEEFLPLVGNLYHCKIFLVVTIFLCISATVPFPVMLVLALVIGVIWDARHLTIDAASSETSGRSLDLALGYTAFLLGLFGSALQGLSPHFQRKKFLLPILLVGFCITLWQIAEYLLIAFRRGNSDFDNQLWLKIASSTAISLVLALVFFLLLSYMSQLLKYKLNLTGTRHYRYGR